jgi:acetyltransferase-like isoleucine patch superfamily enzyme
MHTPSEAEPRAVTVEPGAVFIAADAVVHPSAGIGAGSAVWGLSHVRENASIGEACIVGRGVYVDHGVIVGARSKLQNGAQLFAPAVVAEGVFIGPGAMLTNDVYPRAITPQGELKSLDDWEPTGVTVERGASVGAGAIIVAGVTIGAWSVVAAGAVVTRDVRPHELVGGVPARRMGWVGRTGRPLVADGEVWTDGTDRYRIVDEQVEVVT